MLITADDEDILKQAAYDSTATPGAVIGRIEGGVEGFVDEDKTPDNRLGAVVQYWFNSYDVKKFEVELSYRIRQDILVKPFTSVFNMTNNPKGFIDMMRYVGHCGDGYEWEEKVNNRNMIIVPIAVPDFKIEHEIAYSEGIMGANFWYMCNEKKAVVDAGRTIIENINNIEGIILPFGICAAASKTETNYPWIGPTTNHPYCPSLKKKLVNESKVPKDVKYIPEIVINGVNKEAVNKAVKIAIDSIVDRDDIVKISAGNFNGELGNYNFNLLDILNNY